MVQERTRRSESSRQPQREGRRGWARPDLAVAVSGSAPALASPKSKLPGSLFFLPSRSTLSNSLRPCPDQLRAATANNPQEPMSDQTTPSILRPFLLFSFLQTVTKRGGPAMHRTFDYACKQSLAAGSASTCGRICLQAARQRRRFAGRGREMLMCRRTIKDGRGSCQSYCNHSFYFSQRRQMRVARTVN